MRRALLSLTVLAAAALAAPSLAHAQQSQQSAQQEIQQRMEEDAWRRVGPRLSDQVNAGPCPFVKILYDAARYIEFTAAQPSSSTVGYTGEIEEIASVCSYREDDPITVNMDILFHLGRGPTATAPSRTYRYWIAVTDRNRAVLAKEYFNLPVDFGGADRTYVTEEIRNLVIPRASAEVSGSNFEILIGFDVTPEMAEFNRTGSRFLINAGQSSGQP